VPLGRYFERVRERRLPQLPVAWGEVPGRSGQLIVTSRHADAGIVSCTSP
jgi:hypothetical protein